MAIVELEELSKELQEVAIESLKFMGLVDL